MPELHSYKTHNHNTQLERVLSKGILVTGIKNMDAMDITVRIRKGTEEMKSVFLALFSRHLCIMG
jgi:hypothetical protein